MIETSELRLLTVAVSHVSGMFGANGAALERSNYVGLVCRRALKAYLDMLLKEM